MTKRKSRGGGRKRGPLSKKAQNERKTLFLLDETGFYLLPSLAKSYAKIGKVKEIRVKLTRSHLSAIGGVTPQGNVNLQTKQTALNATDVVWFLRHLLLRYDRVLVVWDGSQIHSRSRLVQNFVATVGSKRLTIENLPGYAPELNPAEGLWQHLKNVGLRNVRTDNLVGLETEVRRAVNRVRLDPGLIQSFFAKSELDISDLI